MNSRTGPRILIRQQRRCQRTLVAIGILLVLALFLGLPGMLLMQDLPAPTLAQADPAMRTQMAELSDQINPMEGYTISVKFRDVGPRLLAAGAIDLDKFVEAYKREGKSLTNEQMAILQNVNHESITLDAKNAYFLLDFFWALGLVNRNAVLIRGEMVAKGRDKIGSYASTGGWRLGQKPATELYAASLIVPLTQAQQERLEAVSAAVYRPCCDNSAHFPDCNHGMAMLGVLELMASQNAGVEEMFEAAKYVNAFWYPRQMLEVAAYFKANANVDFSQADPAQVVSRQYASSSGFQAVHSWLEAHGKLPQDPGAAGSCGVE